MGLDLLPALGRLATATPPLEAALRTDVADSFLDTLAVAHAGRHEPVVRKLTACHGEHPALAEHAALRQATAAHALDFDDVQLASVVHLSAVVVPALIAVARTAAERPAPRDMVAAYLAGLRVARHLGRALGPAHYAAGWHATSTIGPVAAAAAVARLGRAPSEVAVNAIALALCQASGLQKSFGSMAKPLQAGLAAAAGVRSALWARAGLQGPADPFGPGGFLALYGGAAEGLDAPGDEAFTVDVARKGFACCYGAHRLIAAALDLHQQLGGRAFEAVTVTAQTGTLRPLRAAPPTNGNEARFCAEHLIAVALVDGEVARRHFEDPSLQRPDLLAARRRVTVIESGPTATALGDGVVTARCALADGSALQSAPVLFFPGSPESPLSAAAFEAKLLDCLDGSPSALAALRREVAAMLDTPTGVHA